MIDIYIPHYRKSRHLLEMALSSALADKPPGSTVTIVANGDIGVRNARSLGSGTSARVLESERPLGLTASWNACISDASADLVHILHDDDAVAPGFYAAIGEMRARYPRAALYATGKCALGPGGTAVGAGTSGEGEYWWVAGQAAARLLLEGNRHHCGSVVISRQHAASLGGFTSAYAYCPDEEAYLRYAAYGGIAFAPACLYLVRQHGEQTSLETWRRPDFVSQYVAARRAGASHFGNETEAIAARASASRVISVAVTLAEDGDYEAARTALRELGRVLPSARARPAYRATYLASHSRLLLKAAIARRRWAARRRAGLRR